MKQSSFIHPLLLRRVSAQRGFLLIVVMLMISGLLFISTVALRRSVNTSQQVQRDYSDERVFQVAEGGADVARSWLITLLGTNPNPTQSTLNTFPLPTLAGFTYPELTITKQALQTGVVVTHGAMAGLRANIQPYEVLSHAANTRSTNEKIVRLFVNQEAVGLYQFGIYYDSDLEIFPDFPLDYEGRIHTNGNLYLGSHNTLDLESAVTAAGHIYNTPKDPTRTYNGKARIKNNADHWNDLSYDSRSANWVTNSLNDWDGNVQDSAHGVTRLPFPLPTTAVAHDIIERAVSGESAEIQAKKYWYKAGLRIVDGVAKDSLGNTVTLPSGILTSSTVYDYREQANMSMTNLDMAALMSNNKVPVNRIIYFSKTGAHSALRIKNAGTLPTGGIVIATDNPCYVWKNYNTVSKKPSSILCDAFNVYSNAWSDANASKALNKRIASATTINTCVVTGNKTTTSGHYSGGAENLIRLHEKWVGHELTYSGSLICLWESEQAIGDFINASYVEAQRDWEFDESLLDPSMWPKDALSSTQVTRGAWTPY